MPLWIALTIGAAFLQNLRSTLQKHLTAELSPVAATYVRFAFGVPVAAAFVLALSYGADIAIPSPNKDFLYFCVTGGFAQIFGTVLMVALFSYRNFTVGNAYSKTEAAQTALFGILILGEHLSLGAAAAIAISLIGVVLISSARGALTPGLLFASLIGRPALMGIGAGSCFGVASVSYRAASLSLGRIDFLMPAAFTLLMVLTIQTAVMTAWIAWREAGQFRATASNWKVSFAVGITGAVASLGWFTAMTIENAAYVRALGQIELLFAFAASVFFFKEKIRRMELAGIALVVGGLLLLLFAR